MENFCGVISRNAVKQKSKFTKPPISFDGLECITEILANDLYNTQCDFNLKSSDIGDRDAQLAKNTIELQNLQKAVKFLQCKILDIEKEINCIEEGLNHAEKCVNLHSIPDESPNRCGVVDRLRCPAFDALLKIQQEIGKIGDAIEEVNCRLPQQEPPLNTKIFNVLNYNVQILENVEKCLEKLCTLGDDIDEKYKIIQQIQINTPSCKSESEA